MPSDKSPMATSNMIDNIDSDTAEVDEASQVTDNIEKLENKIRELQAACILASQNADPENLSILMLRLARVNSDLGRDAAYAAYIARNADRAARRARGQKVINLSKTMAVNKAEPQAEIDSKSLFQTASDAQLLADESSDLCYRTDTFLKLSQSRLSLIKNDALRA